MVPNRKNFRLTGDRLSRPVADRINNSIQSLAERSGEVALFGDSTIGGDLELPAASDDLVIGSKSEYADETQGLSVRATSFNDAGRDIAGRFYNDPDTVESQLDFHAETGAGNFAGSLVPHRYNDGQDTVVYADVVMRVNEADSEDGWKLFQAAGRIGLSRLYHNSMGAGDEGIEHVYRGNVDPHLARDIAGALHIFNESNPRPVGD